MKEELDLKTIKDAAHRLLFDMSEEEFLTLQSEFKVTLKQMKVLGEIEGIDEVAPMTFPIETKITYLREDVAEEPLSNEEVLSNVKEKQSGQIKLPKVVL